MTVTARRLEGSNSLSVTGLLNTISYQYVQLWIVVLILMDGLQRDVQHHAMVLLGRTGKHSPFPKWAIATAAEVRKFDPDEGECCTVKRFCIDISGTPASPWNESATRVFVKNFLTVAQFKCRNRSKIRDMFRSHFKTLQRHYRKVGKAHDERDSNQDDDVDASSAVEEGRPTTSKKPSSSRNPNDTWFKSSSTGKGKATAPAAASAIASTSAIIDMKAHSRYQRKYTVRAI